MRRRAVPRAPEAAARWGMDGLFDAQVFSYEVRSRSSRIDACTRRSSARSDVPAAEAVFIDDAPANVAAAQDLGMEGIHFHRRRGAAGRIGATGHCASKLNEEGGS